MSVITCTERPFDSSNLGESAERLQASTMKSVFGNKWCSLGIEDKTDFSPRKQRKTDNLSHIIPRHVAGMSLVPVLPVS